MTKKSKKCNHRQIDGLPVVDATDDIEITITKADVANSKKKDPANCAAAKAGHRELKREVRVFLSRMYVKEKNHWIRYLTPETISREIVSFDRGSDFVPGGYVFKAPTASSKLGAYSVGRTRTGKGLKRKRHVTGNVRVSAKDYTDK